MPNNYSGYVVSQPDLAIDRVPPTISPEEFYNEYVAKRKPCIISGTFADEKWTAGKKWTDFEYLRKSAGHVELQIEKRDSTIESFGRDKKV